MLAKGQILQDRYRIDALLGEGGMGAVYKAWDTRLKVPVALKEMRPQPDLAPETLAQLRQQFEQEATIVARLSHSHLVRVGDFFEEGENAYLVMDFVEGESLIDLIKKKGVLPEQQVLTWARQLLSALAYCHQRGVIHRDVKPQNVIITPEGRAVLVDFGLVKLWDPDDPSTKTAMRGVGTPEYAPPEQYSTKLGHTDSRSDLYGLAATMYHALSGEPPPSAADRMSDPEQFIPLRQLAPDVSGRTGIAVMKALALPRSQRWHSAKEMVDALVQEEVVAPRPVPKEPSPAPTAEAATTQVLSKEREKATARARPKRGWIWLVAVALILPGVALGVWWYQSSRPPAVIEESPTAAATSTPATADAPTPTANPTATPQPTITPTPRPSASDKARAFAEPILTAIADRLPDYADDFGDPGSGWTLRKTADIESGYQDGEYFIVVSPDYSTSSESTALPAFSDFVLEIDGRFASGDGGFWGISWHWGDEQITGLLIPLSGSVLMVHCEGEDCSSLGEIRKPSLNPEHATNHLQIVVKGSEIAVAINGEWQTLATDLYYTTPGTRQIRLEVLNNGDTPLEVRWDNLKVWDSSDLPTPTTE